MHLEEAKATLILQGMPLPTFEEENREGNQGNHSGATIFLIDFSFINAGQCGRGG
jgi:hypothetical protein